MENVAVAGPSKKYDQQHDPAWLLILLQDSLREAEDALIMDGMICGTDRGIVWNMAAKLGCDKVGLQGQACRVFERYLAHLIRIGFAGKSFILIEHCDGPNHVSRNRRSHSVDHECEARLRQTRRAGAAVPCVRAVHGTSWHVGFDGSDPQQVWRYMTQRLMITLACCLTIATQATRVPARVCPNAIRAYLASCGYEYTIDQIKSTEREIFMGIGFSVPPYNSLEMAELLADHLNVAHEALALFVDQAERRRHHIEEEVRLLAGLYSMPYCHPRVRTLHLAAGCVAAVVKKAGLTTSDETAYHLARMIRVTSGYIKIVRHVILRLVISPRTPPKHIPNILKRKRFDANGDEPQPSTSKSMNMKF